jgi:hypothetical protein
MAQEDPKGFAVDLTELDQIANEYLPRAVAVLQGSIGVIQSHEGLEGPGRLAELFPMEDEYAAFTDSLGNQQRVGCERIEATSEALREIVELYRRVDGQR